MARKYIVLAAFVAAGCGSGNDAVSTPPTPSSEAAVNRESGIPAAPSEVDSSKSYAERGEK